MAMVARGGRSGPIPEQAWERVVLPDGTAAVVARQGEWALVRMPSGREGRIRAVELEAFLARGGRREPTRAELAAMLQMGLRRTTWQLIGLVALMLAIMLALLLLRLTYGG
jgi:hypothetical protein